jgi:hypothetical protein
MPHDCRCFDNISPAQPSIEASIKSIGELGQTLAENLRQSLKVCSAFSVAPSDSLLKDFSTEARVPVLPAPSSQKKEAVLHYALLMIDSIQYTPSSACCAAGSDYDLTQGYFCMNGELREQQDFWRSCGATLSRRSLCHGESGYAGSQRDLLYAIGSTPRSDSARSELSTIEEYNTNAMPLHSGEGP